MFFAHDGPELPAFQSRPMPDMHERVNVIVCHHVLLSRLNVNRHEHKLDLVAEEAVFKMPIQKQDGGIVQLRDTGALLKINGKEREAMDVRFGLSLAAGEGKKLKDMKPVLRTKTIVAQQRIKNVKLLIINLLAEGIREQRGRRPGLGILPDLVIKERTYRFGP